MNIFVSVFRQTIVPILVILTLFITVANAQSTKTVSSIGISSQAVRATHISDTNGCNIPPMPSYSSLQANVKFPDPFKFMNGSYVKTTADWQCRRAEIAALAQEFEYGYKQSTPYSATTGSFASNALKVTVIDNGDTISFSCSITYPSTGSAPYPAMIGVGGSSLNNSILSSLGVAVINFPNNDIAQQTDASSRGKGKFYEMYGSNHSAGALMAWAWGVDRLIDAIEKTPTANLDPARLGVTGCSRNGKGALCVGAFDERIKLTIPQESGSGGDASWRVSDSMMVHGQTTQTLNEITGENCWFRQNFNQFNSTATKLPFDQHSIIGLIAPRACLLIENSILWLGPESGWISANAAHIIWESLRLYDRMGFSQYTHTSSHCGFQSVQQPEVTAFVKRFLVGNDSTANTDIVQNDLGFNFDFSKWFSWGPYPITISHAEDQQSSFPTGYALEQNYPNPFNPSTTISFTIPENVFVSLKIHNPLGQEIAELAGRKYSAGRHSVTFNASNLASGVYYCAMKTGGFSEVQKMTLQK